MSIPPEMLSVFFLLKYIGVLLCSNKVLSRGYNQPAGGIFMRGGVQTSSLGDILV